MDLIIDFPGGARVDAHFCGHVLPTEGIRVIQRNHPNPETGLMDKIDLDIQVPPSFPKQYHSALIRSAELCKVKKSLETPPQFEITTTEVEFA